MKDWAEKMRSSAKRLVEEYIPNELPFFDRIWPKLEQEIQRWREQPPAAGAVARYRKRATSLLGPDVRIRGGLITPQVLAVLSASILELASYEPDKRQRHMIEHVITNQGWRFGLSLQKDDRLRKLAHGLADVVEAEMQGLDDVRQPKFGQESKPYMIRTHEGSMGPFNAAGLEQWRKTIQPEAFSVWLNEIENDYQIEQTPVQLSGTPLETLKRLVMERGMSMRMSDLYKHVYGEEFSTDLTDEQRVRDAVSHLRRALADARPEWKRLVPNAVDGKYRWCGGRTFCIISYSDG